MTKDDKTRITDVLALSDSQINQILDVLMKLWSDGKLIVYQGDDALSLNYHRPSIEKYVVEGISKEKLPQVLSGMFAFFDVLLRSDNEDDLIAKLSLDDSFKSKIISLRKTITQIPLLSEIDYKLNSNSYNIHMRTLRYNIKSYYSRRSSQQVPIVSISFITGNEGDDKFTSFELSKVELKQLIDRLQEVHKKLEQVPLK